MYRNLRKRDCREQGFIRADHFIRSRSPKADRCEFFAEVINPVSHTDTHRGRLCDAQQEELLDVPKRLGRTQFMPGQIG